MNRALVVAGLLALLFTALTSWLLLQETPPGQAGSGSDQRVAAPTGPGQSEVLDPGATPDPSTTNLVGGSTRVDVDAADASESEPESAQAGFRVDLLVLDQASNPIPGARVSATQPQRESEGSTDPDGRLLLTLDPAEPSVDLLVEAEGHLHHQRSTRVAPQLRVVLHAVVPLAGRVIDRESGAPLAAASISIADGHRDCPDLVATSRADGSFELAAVPVAQAFSLVARAEGHADRTQRLELSSGEDSTEVELRLERSVLTRLSFVDFETTRPVAGIALSGREELGTSDELGLLDVSTLVTSATERLYLRARGQGYLEVSGGLEGAELRGGALVEVPLLRGARWQGSVRDEAGEPLEGARVRLRYSSWSRRSRRGKTAPPVAGWDLRWKLSQESRDSQYSDASGRFVTSGVPPGATQCRLIVSLQGYEARVLQLEAAPTPGLVLQRDVVLTKAEGGTLRGNLSVGGRPATGGRVFWTGAEDSGSAPVTPDGRFELIAVEPGSVVLNATPVVGPLDCDDLLNELGLELDLALDEEREVEFDLNVGWASISGRLVGTADQVRGGRAVVAREKGGDAIARAWTEADGSFVFDVPATDDLWSVSLDEDRLHRLKDVAAGARGLELNLRSTGVLRVRLREAGTREVVRSFVIYGRAADELSSKKLLDTRREPTDPDGWTYLDATTGPLELILIPHDASLPDAVTRAVVAPGDETRVEAVLEVPAELTILLSNTQGLERQRAFAVLVEERIADELPPITEGVNVYNEISRRLPGQRSWRSRRVNLGNDLKTRVGGLRAGRYKLVATKPGYLFEPDSFDIDVGSTEPVEVRWSLQDG